MNPVIVTRRDNKDYIGVLLYSYYTTIIGWGGPPNLYTLNLAGVGLDEVVDDVAVHRLIPRLQVANEPSWTLVFIFVIAQFRQFSFSTTRT